MKIKSLFTSLIFSSLLISCGPNVKEILKKSFDKCQSIQNGYYEMTSYANLKEGKDTSINSYACYFQKLKDDSLYSSAFHYKYYRTGKNIGDVIYTGDDFVNVNVKDSTATIMSKTMWAKDIKTNSHMYTFYSPLTSRNSSPLPSDSEFKDGKHIYKFIGEENLNNTVCYHIQENEIPKDDKASPIKTIKWELHFWISKSDLIPIQYSLEVEGIATNFNNETIYQYTRNALTKYEINNLKDKSILTLESIPADYKIKEYIPESKEFVPLLDKGTIPPNWQLVSLTDEKISLTDLKGKLVLIDFFYKSCIPCMQALPSLQALHDKFKNKGLRVIGIDPTNESESDLPAFLAKRGVTYTILLADEDVARAYHVKGYPTMYLIDKSGKIIFSHLGGGYDQDLENTLEALILKNL